MAFNCSDVNSFIAYPLPVREFTADGSVCIRMILKPKILNHIIPIIRLKCHRFAGKNAKKIFRKS